MKLYFKGHDYKYASEQIMLMMFPEQRPEYTDKYEKAEDNSAFIGLYRGGALTTARTVINFGGKTAEGRARVRNELFTDPDEENRKCQKLIRLSFYKAAVKILGTHPQWGALTGVRPGKIATRLMREGLSPDGAVSRLQSEFFVSRERAELCVKAAEFSEKAEKSLDKRDIMLYIGIPFCPTRCAYCSFVSQSVAKSMKLIEPFLDALYRELDSASELVREMGLNIVSVYMGGGTPTTLSAPQLGELIARVNRQFDLSGLREFTVEAGRPDTITREKMRVLRQCGVTRVSINPQTMQDEVLAAIGRKHTAQDIITAYGAARAEGISEVNMDLIAGLPQDTAEGFADTLNKVVAMAPENVTVHTLALKKGTKITLEGTKLPTEDEVRQMLDYSMEKLSGAGYEPYYLYRQKFMSGGFENVGWSKSGTENLYNIAIMEELCSIIALGGGGSTKFVSPVTGKIERVFNAKYPQEYIENIDKAISEKYKMKEFYRREKIF